MCVQMAKHLLQSPMDTLLFWFRCRYVAKIRSCCNFFYLVQLRIIRFRRSHIYFESLENLVCRSLEGSSSGTLQTARKAYIGDTQLRHFTPEQVWVD